MGSKLPAINLLKKEQNFLDKFISWALTVGRVLVILTEFVALGAFVYRFSLDQQLSDLHDNINTKAKILTLLQNNEIIFRNLQQRLALLSSLAPESPYYATIMNDFISLAPSNIIINKISFTNGSINMDVIATSTSSLQSFIDSLRGYKGTTSIAINNIQDQPSKGDIAVSIAITTKSLAQ